MEADPLRESEERVFLDLIEDVLRSTPALQYRVKVFDPDERDEDDGTYATFVFETNPAHDLEVAIELTESGFRVQVNDETFSIPVDNPRRIDRWMEKRCRDVENLVKGDLKIEVESLFGRFLSSDLYAGRDDRWVDIAERDEGWGWIGLTAWLLPFGISPFRTEATEYRNWFGVTDRDDETPPQGRGG